MSIASALEAELKSSLKAHDAARVACIRQLRSKVQEVVNSANFDGKQDDALYQKVISAYIKQLKQGIHQMAGAGARSAALLAQYQAEIDYLEPYLPRLLDAAATRPLVQQALTALQSHTPPQAGRVLGYLIKQHPGQLDVALTKKLIEAALHT